MGHSTRLEIADQHVRRFFAGHAVAEHQWTLGPVPCALPEFRVLCVAPGVRTAYWTFVSVGASSIAHEVAERHEFLIIAPAEDLKLVELLTMAAWYHQSERLGLGHTLPIGEPWLAASLCNHLMVSLPYPFGPDLEICDFPDGHIHFYWLLPITESERDYKVAHGVDALEQLFDESQLEYWDVSRQTVV